eukprot:bmy_05885T0
MVRPGGKWAPGRWGAGGSRRGQFHAPFLPPDSCRWTGNSSWPQELDSAPWTPARTWTVAQAAPRSSATPTASAGTTRACGAPETRRTVSSPWTPSACPAATTTSSSRPTPPSGWVSARAPAPCASAASGLWARRSRAT